MSEPPTRLSRGYVVDDLALVAGLTSTADERHRHELSWLIDDAVKGGPALDVPALCLTEATTARRSIAEHVADLVASAPLWAWRRCCPLIGCTRMCRSTSATPAATCGVPGWCWPT